MSVSKIYSVKGLMIQLQNEYGMVNYDVDTNHIKSSEGNYLEMKTTLEVEDVGKRADYEIIDLDKREFETVQELEIYCLLECFARFNITPKSDEELGFDTDTEQEEESQDEEQKNNNLDSKQEQDTQDTKDKDNNSGSLTIDDLNEEDLNKWSKKSIKVFSIEANRLKGNKKQLDIESNDKLNKYVKKFSKSDYYSGDNNLETHNDIVPRNIKEFNNYLESEVIPMYKSKAS